MTELGQILSNLVNIVPDGMVVFLPSYSFLNAIRAKWKETGVLDRLNQKKTVCLPYSSCSLNDAEIGPIRTAGRRKRRCRLAEFTAAIRDKVIPRLTFGTSTLTQPQQKNPKSTGALLLAVVGAKLSEGLNFSDDLARAVVVVGFTIANLGSAELKERMRFVKELEEKNRGGGGAAAAGAKDAGMELYENICMKAVNQSIGASSVQTFAIDRGLIGNRRASNSTSE